MNDTLRVSASISGSRDLVALQIASETPLKNADIIDILSKLITELSNEVSNGLQSNSPSTISDESTSSASLTGD